MNPAVFPLLLLLTFATSRLMAGLTGPNSRPAVSRVTVVVYWLCNLLVPVQILALADLCGLPVFLKAGYLFSLNGFVFSCTFWLWRKRSAMGTSTVAAAPHPALPWHVLTGLVIVACTYFTLVLRVAFTFPDAWDAVAYHYPVALRWLQEGTMRINGATNWHAGLPGNVELLDLLVLATGREKLLGLVQWPGLVLLILSTLPLSRRLAESDAPAWPVATTILMIPVVANQTTSGYVDLSGTAFLLASLVLVLEYADQLKANQGAATSRGLLIAAGLACGLAIGTKPVFWFYAVALFAATYILMARQQGGRDSRLRSSLGWFVLAGAVPSLFWFVRAAVGTGNPLFPIEIHAGPVTLPGVSRAVMASPDHYLGWVRHGAEWFIYPWTEWKRHPGPLLTNYTTGDGLGGAFATFVVPGIWYAAALAKSRRPALRGWLVSLALLAVAWWLLMNRIGRYALPFCVLAAVISSPLFELLERRATTLYRLLYVLVFSVTAGVLAVEPLYAVAQTVRYRSFSRAAYLNYPAMIDTAKPGSRVLNLTHETFNFALAGKHLLNQVIPSWEAPLALTTEYLRTHHIDYVAERTDDAASAPLPPAAGLVLQYRGRGEGGGEQGAEWRIWAAKH